MKDCEELAQFATTNNPATQDEILRVQKGLECTLPQDYIDFLKCSNGISADGIRSLLLYDTDSVLERNSTFEVSTYAPPSWILIGDDGGGRGIFLDCASEKGSVYQIGLGSMLRSDAVFLASSLTDWIERRFAGG